MWVQLASKEQESFETGSLDILLSLMDEQDELAQEVAQLCNSFVDDIDEGLGLSRVSPNDDFWNYKRPRLHFQSS